MPTSDARKLRDLQKVLDVTRLLAATVDLDDLLAEIIEKSMDLLRAERASLFLYDAQTNELVSRVAASAKEIRFSADLGLAGAAVKTGHTINIPDAHKDPRFNSDIDRKTGFRTRNILSVPLRDYEDKLVGVLQVLNTESGEFTDYDVSLAETLAAQAGAALQRANLMEHLIEKQELQRAMAIAREIQSGLFPDGSPHTCGFDVAGFSQPADDTGGDTYDFMHLTDGRWLLTVADASGHGIGPALVVAQTRAILRAIGFHGANITSILHTANELLAMDLEGRFVTCFLGILDPIASQMKYASAGHGPLLFFDHAADTFEELPATGLPLGIMPDMDYSEVTLYDFTPGDLAIITTDGFFEAMNPQNEMFGIQRMLDLIRRDHELPASEIIAHLRDAVDTFTAGLPQADDLTIIIVKRRKCPKA